METDEKLAITDPDDAAWIAAERTRVIEYLATEGCEHAGVSLEPRWFLSPYLAIWAVRSKKNPDRIGWWVISGDCPTDYVTCTTERDNADVLLAFAREWKSAAAHMANGEWAPDQQLGPPGQQKELAPLLMSRAEKLEHFANEIRAPSEEIEP